MNPMPYEYRIPFDFTSPRSLKVGDEIVVDGEIRRIQRINTNRIRVTVYYMKQKRGGGETVRGYTFWTSVGEVKARKVRKP